mmetsp:Transcript_34630/g.99504  ORF Transcript_34630/g.99504 Transcript_34630/m.99504 type:complete len:352 (+) Transcript_34630:370-1425(+)
MSGALSSQQLSNLHRPKFEWRPASTAPRGQRPLRLGAPGRELWRVAPRRSRDKKGRGSGLLRERLLRGARLSLRGLWQSAAEALGVGEVVPMAAEVLFYSPQLVLQLLGLPPSIAQELRDQIVPVPLDLRLQVRSEVRALPLHLQPQALHVRSVSLLATADRRVELVKLVLDLHGAPVVVLLHLRKQLPRGPFQLAVLRRHGRPELFQLCEGLVSPLPHFVDPSSVLLHCRLKRSSLLVGLLELPHMRRLAVLVPSQNVLDVAHAVLEVGRVPVVLTAELGAERAQLLLAAAHALLHVRGPGLLLPPSRRAQQAHQVCLQALQLGAVLPVGALQALRHPLMMLLDQALRLL